MAEESTSESFPIVRRRIPELITAETGTLLAGQFAAVWTVPSASRNSPAEVAMPLMENRVVTLSRTTM